MNDLPRVLFVDDDVNLLSGVSRVLRGQCDLTVAKSGAEAIEIMSTRPQYAVLVSDHGMPEMRGDELLAEAARRWPLTMRVMLTGNADQTTAAAAVNAGGVFRFARKPCETGQLIEIIKSAHAQHLALLSEKALLENTLAGSVKVLTDVLLAVRPNIFQRSQQVRSHARVLAERLDLPRVWEIELAAMLYPLGLVFIPNDVALRYGRGEKMTLGEQQLIDMSIDTAAKLVRNIPRLENIALGLSMCRIGYDGSGVRKNGVSGDDLPVISRVLRVLIDIVDALASNETDFDGLAAYMDAQAHLYDPQMLVAALAIVQAAIPPEVAHGPKPVGALKPGDVLAEDLLDLKGMVVVARGTELTETTILGLVQKRRAQRIPEEIMVVEGASPLDRAG